MAYLNEDIKLGKKGVNYVTMIVDECMCSFHKIEQENDVGIDGQIELFDERRFTYRQTNQCSSQNWQVLL